MSYNNEINIKLDNNNYKIIYDDYYEKFHIVIYKCYRTRYPSLTKYKLFINNMRIEFYNNDKSFIALYSGTVYKNNVGGWKKIYSDFLKIPVDYLDKLEHIIYQDLYRVNDDFPKVVFRETEPNRYKRYMLRNHWCTIPIELPEVFIHHFPQYKWII